MVLVYGLNRLIVFPALVVAALNSLISSAYANTFLNIDDRDPNNLAKRTHDWSTQNRVHIQKLVDQAILFESEQLHYGSIEISIKFLYQGLDSDSQSRLDDSLANFNLNIEDLDKANIHFLITPIKGKESALNIRLVAVEHKDKYVSSEQTGVPAKAGGRDSSGSPPVSSKIDPGDLLLQVHLGVANSQKLIDIFRGEIYGSKFSTKLLGVEFGQDLYPNVLGTDWTIGWRAGLGTYFEDDKYVVNAGISFKYPDSYRGNRMYWQIIEGISHAPNDPSDEEIENVVGHSGKFSKTMNSMVFTIGFNAADVFNKHSYENCSVGATIKHRSGVFERIGLYNNVEGGSDFISAFWECGI